MTYSISLFNANEMSCNTLNMFLLVCILIDILILNLKRLFYYGGHYILRLFYILPNFYFTVSETWRDY